MLIPLEEAFQKIDENVQPLPPRKVPPLDAVNCALAEDVVASINVPDFASSAMDGIAVSQRDLKQDYPISLQVQGVIAAGHPASDSLQPGHAYRIMTGASLPEGADAIVIVEEVQFEDDRVIIPEQPSNVNHIRPMGNDIKQGETVFRSGYVLKHPDAGVLSSLGLSEVLVHPKPSIAVMSTGSEVRRTGENLQPGQIYNSNDTTLRSLLIKFGLPDPGAEDPIRDDPAHLKYMIERLCGRYDVVITSGAVSMGSFDYIPDVVQKLGGRLLFHKAFVKPGKPALIARIGNSWLLALPGNPVSVAVTFHLYGKRLIARLMGWKYLPQREKAIVTAPFPVKGVRFQVVGAYLNRTEEGLLAIPAGNYTSGRLSALKGVDGYILVPGGSRTVEAGTEVEIEWL